MQDDYIRSRGFALTLARRALDDLRRDQFRQLRNYVDLCQALAYRSRFNNFFSQAQQVLQRADSLYDALFQTLLDQVEGERLCTFGVNFGAGGIVYGAARLKEEIERTGRPGAWLNTANCASPGLEEAVCRAEEAGKYGVDSVRPGRSRCGPGPGDCRGASIQRFCAGGAARRVQRHAGK